MIEREADGRGAARKVLDVDREKNFLSQRKHFLIALFGYNVNL